MLKPVFSALVCICLTVSAALATPQTYRLNTDRSQVEFLFSLNGAPQSGRMPVATASMLIDLDTVSASRVTVTLNARAVRTGFIFATQALKAPDMLHTARHPAITFRSTSISGTPAAATVTGDLTIRGITRPVILRAGLYRQRGTAIGERDHLTILLTGAVSRAAFGLVGYGDLVADRIDLRILAEIDK